MNVIAKPAAASGVATDDLDRFRLRRFIESLAGSDELAQHDEPVDLAGIARILEGNLRAVHFRAAGPERQEIVGNVVSSRNRIARAFGVAPERLAAEIARRLAGRPQIVEVAGAEAPVQQAVLAGDAADLTALPVHLQHGLDGAPYISASIDYVIDSRTGWTNVGIRRMMLRGRQEAGVDLVSPSDLRALYEASAAAGRPLPVSFVVGAHPADYVAAMMRMPVDELGIVASLRDAPLPVVKCVTNDIRVPADAEMVLEGFFDARGHVEAEGPYGEFLGYYGAVKRNPVFHLTAITRRRDALFQTATIGGRAMSRTDTAVLGAVRTEVMLWKALEIAVREPVAVYATASSGGNFNVRVALRQRVPGEARNAITACMSALVNVKNVFVVDPDIDVTSDEQIDWALATRFQPDRDLIVVPGMRTLPLDPSIAGGRVGAKAGFDLTWPFGTGNRLETRVPEPPRFEGRRFESVEVALRDGPKFFEELMTATGSRDGREIVRELDVLRSSPGLDRDNEGRYVLKAGAVPSPPPHAGEGRLWQRHANNAGKPLPENRNETGGYMTPPRTILVAALGLALALCLAAPAAAEDTVRIGMARSVSNGAELIAIEKGYFKEAGIKVEMEDIDTSANTIALLATNRLQIVAGGISAGYFNAIEKDLPITVIADRVSAPVGHNLMLRPDLKDKVTNLAQLKGKVIASNGAGSVSTYEVGKMLETAGLTIADVDVKIFPFTQMPVAFANKAIDAGIVIPPFVWQFAEQNLALNFAEPDALVKPSPMTIAVIMVNTDWAKKNAAVLRNYYTAYLRGLRDYCDAYHGDPVKDEIIAALIRHGSERRPELLHKYPWPARSPDGRINIASMLDMQDWYVKNGYSRTRFPAERLVDTSYADYAVQKLGPYVPANKDSKLEGCR